MAIVAEGLTKQYGDKLAVDNLSLTIEPGRVTGFLGPNGAGKSTTMRMMLDIDRATRGTTTFDGQRFRKLDSPLKMVGSMLDANAVEPDARPRPTSVTSRRRRACPIPVSTRSWPSPVSPMLRSARRQLLARHAPAARHRGRTARRSQVPVLRRADERARSRRHPVGTRVPPAARRRRPRRVGVEPPAQRVVALCRPHRRDRQGPVHRERQCPRFRIDAGIRPPSRSSRRGSPS